MKKLFLLFVISSCSAFSQTKLVDAIIQSDYDSVCKILEKETITPEKKDALLELADNVILHRRANTNFDWIKQFTSQKTLLGAILLAIYMHDNIAIQNRSNLLKLNPENKIFSKKSIERDLIILYLNGILGTTLFTLGLLEGACYQADSHANLEAAEKIKYVLSLA